MILLFINNKIMCSTKYSPRRSSRSTKRLSTKKRSRSTKKRSTKKKSICWEGYHRVKGTVPYSKGSCAKD